MSQNYAHEAFELLNKTKNDIQNAYIAPITEARKNINKIKNMSYRELSSFTGKDNNKYLNAAYARYIQAGKTPEEAKQLSLEALKKMFEKDRSSLISVLEAEINAIEKNHKKTFAMNINKLMLIVERWNIRKEIMDAETEKDAELLAKLYATAYNNCNKNRINYKDILYYFPDIKKKSDGTVVLKVKDTNSTQHYQTKHLTTLKITEIGFTLSCIEYTQTSSSLSGISGEMDKYEKAEAELVNNISPKDFLPQMFASPITEKEIVDRCLISHVNYIKGKESAAGVQVKYEGENAYEKFYEICEELLTSDVFHEILGKTSMFLTYNLVNHKEIFKKRIEKERYIY